LLHNSIMDNETFWEMINEKVVALMQESGRHAQPHVLVHDTGVAVVFECKFFVRDAVHSSIVAVIVDDEGFIVSWDGCRKPFAANDEQELSKAVADRFTHVLELALLPF